MEKDIIEKYKKAGEVSKEAKIFARSQIKDGTKILDLADKIEKLIRDKADGTAFPVNVSINDIAAHYAPDINDETILKNGDLVKIDVGVHVDGYIADTAFSVCVGEKTNPLITAAEDAVNKFIQEIRPGKTIQEMSAMVEEVVLSHGVNPVRNLAGHSIEQYMVHGNISIPPTKITNKQPIEEGTALGFEVFTTKGDGWVKESSPTLIYMLVYPKPVRLRESRIILEKIVNDYKTLPFAKRWLKDVTSPLRLQLALKELVNNGVIKEYPPLREKSNSPTAQAEETILVFDKPIVTTKI